MKVRRFTCFRQGCHLKSGSVALAWVWRELDMQFHNVVTQFDSNKSLSVYGQLDLTSPSSM